MRERPVCKHRRHVLGGSRVRGVVRVLAALFRGAASRVCLRPPRLLGRLGRRRLLGALALVALGAAFARRLAVRSLQLALRPPLLAQLVSGDFGGGLVTPEVDAQRDAVGLQQAAELEALLAVTSLSNLKAFSIASVGSARKAARLPAKRPSAYRRPCVASMSSLMKCARTSQIGETEKPFASRFSRYPSQRR